MRGAVPPRPIRLRGLYIVRLVVAGSAGRNWAAPHYGKLIGPLQEYAHKIRGTAYAVDESTIFIKGFNYDGTGPGKRLLCSLCCVPPRPHTPHSLSVTAAPLSVSVCV
jgi:hypothetical protein